MNSLVMDPICSARRHTQPQRPDARKQQAFPQRTTRIDNDNDDLHYHHHNHHHHRLEVESCSCHLRATLRNYTIRRDQTAKARDTTLVVVVVT